MRDSKRDISRITVDVRNVNLTSNKTSKKIIKVLRMKKEILQYYEEILLGQRDNFPASYFEESAYSSEKLALSIIKYAIEKHIGWTPVEAGHFFTYDVAKRLKLDRLLRYIRFPVELDEKKDIRYVVHLLYPTIVGFDLRSRIIELYKRVLAGEAKFPRIYFDNDFGPMRAEICLQYALINNSNFHSLNEMYQSFATINGVRFFKDNKLFKLYTSLYRYPLEYLYSALPDSQRNTFLYALYSFKYFNAKQKRKLRKQGKYII